MSFTVLKTGGWNFFPTQAVALSVTIPTWTCTHDVSCGLFFKLTTPLTDVFHNLWRPTPVIISRELNSAQMRHAGRRHKQFIFRTPTQRRGTFIRRQVTFSENETSLLLISVSLLISVVFRYSRWFAFSLEASAGCYT